MVQQDQISLMNEATFKYLDKIKSLENELDKVRKTLNGNYNLICHSGKLSLLILPSSAQAPAQLGLSWLYFQLIQPPTQPPPPPPGKVFSQLQLTKYI